MGKIRFSPATIVPEAQDAQGLEKRRLKLHNHVMSNSGKPSLKKFLVHSCVQSDKRSSNAGSENSGSPRRSRRSSIQSVSNFERQDADIELDDANVDTVDFGRTVPGLNEKLESSSGDGEINENSHLLEQHTKEEMKGILMPFGRCLPSSDTLCAPSVQCFPCSSNFPPAASASASASASATLSPYHRQLFPYRYAPVSCAQSPHRPSIAGGQCI
eukprot:2287885-Pleurochrysis_carterae.AAC.1